MAASPGVSPFFASALLAVKPTTATVLAPTSPFWKKERRLNVLLTALLSLLVFLSEVLLLADFFL